MKKLLLFFIYILLCSFSFTQTIHKGSLLGLHIFNVTLKEGVTMQDFIKFYTNKVIPENDKAFAGYKLFLLRSVRGQDSSKMGLMYVFNSEADRNNYFNNDGSTTAAFDAASKAAEKKWQDLSKEMEKYTTFSNESESIYNDWLVE